MLCSGTLNLDDAFKSYTYYPLSNVSFRLRDFTNLHIWMNSKYAPLLFEFHLCIFKLHNVEMDVRYGLDGSILDTRPGLDESL